jgi:hypothetical protein
MGQHAGAVSGKKKAKTVQAPCKYTRLLEDCNTDIPIFTNLLVEQIIKFTISKHR